jgi:hypothetical protein
MLSLARKWLMHFEIPPVTGALTHFDDFYSESDSMRYFIE